MTFCSDWLLEKPAGRSDWQMPYYHDWSSNGFYLWLAEEYPQRAKTEGRLMIY
jgi:hypothetical protein